MSPFLTMAEIYRLHPFFLNVLIEYSPEMININERGRQEGRPYPVVMFIYYGQTRKEISCGDR